MRHKTSFQRSLLVLSLLSCFVLASKVEAADLKASYLTYEGKNKTGQANFVLESADLLGNFKEIMPGDQVTQKLTIKNDSQTQTTISLAVLSTDEFDLSFLEQLTLSLSQGANTLYQGQINEMTQDQSISLGEFKKNEEKVYLLRLDVPLTLANAYNGYETISEWTFVATDQPRKPEEPQEPQEPQKPTDPPSKPSDPGKPSQPGTIIKRPGSTQKLPQTSELNHGSLLGFGLLLLLSVSLIFQKKSEVSK